MLAKRRDILKFLGVVGYLTVASRPVGKKDYMASFLDAVRSEVPQSLDPYDFVIKTEKGYDVSLLIHSTDKNDCDLQGPGTSFIDTYIYDGEHKGLFRGNQVNAGIISDGTTEKYLILSDKDFASEYASIASQDPSIRPHPDVKVSDIEMEAYADMLTIPVDFKSIEGVFNEVHDCPGLYYLLMDIDPEKNTLLSTPDNIYTWYLKPKAHVVDSDALAGSPKTAEELVPDASQEEMIELGYKPQPVPRPGPTPPVSA